MKTFKIYLDMVKINLKSLFVYKLSTVLGLLSSICMFAAEFSMIAFLGFKVGAISGWTSDELSILYVMTMLSSSIEVFFMDSIRSFGSEIVNGTLDTKLLKPIHPLIVISSRVNTEAISIPLFCLSVLFVVVRRTKQLWTLSSIVWFVISVIGGALVFCSITIFSAAMAFWTYDSDSFYRMFKQGTRQLLWYPIEIYSKAVRMILTFIIPLAFVSFYPSHIILNKQIDTMPFWIPYIGLPVGILCFMGALAFWSFGLKKYEGAGG